MIKDLLTDLSLVALASRDITLKQHGNKWVGLCPVHKERTPSFNIYIGKDGKQRYACFGCGIHGDAISYIMDTRGLDTKGAIAYLRGEDKRGVIERKPAVVMRDRSAIVPLSGIPHTIAGGAIRIWNPNTQEYNELRPEAIYRYPCGYVIRCINGKTGKKWTPMVMWCWIEALGEPGWCFHAFPEPRPLYVQHITPPSSKITIIVEGEKCVNALYSQARDVVYGIFSWPGGCQAVRKANWGYLQPLQNIFIWPDADEPGLNAALQIKKLLPQAKIIDVSHWKNGYDCADAIKDGWKWADFAMFNFLP